MCIFLWGGCRGIRKQGSQCNTPDEEVYSTIDVCAEHPDLYPKRPRWTDRHQVDVILTETQFVDTLRPNALTYMLVFFCQELAHRRELGAASTDGWVTVLPQIGDSSAVIRQGNTF